MTQHRVLMIFGTRPGAIKMMPVIKAMQADPERFEPIVAVTAQHRQLLDQVLNRFDIVPDFDLDLMDAHDSLSERTSKMLHHLDNVVNAAQPDLILTVGDSTTTLAASLSAFYHHVPVAHIEAGLRTYDKDSPYPEEINRQLADRLSDLYFAPTNAGRQRLTNENIPAQQIFVTGNTSIDALKYTVIEDYHHPILDAIPTDHKLILMTVQRHENMGAPIERILRAIRDVVETNPGVELIYPVHLNPEVMNLADQLLGDRDRIHLLAPLDVYDFHNVAARSYVIVTDSGGVQEEAASLHVPVLLLRDETERPESVESGAVKLVGTTMEGIQGGINGLLNDKRLYKKMASVDNPFGDGQTAERIVKIIDEYLNEKHGS